MGSGRSRGLASLLLLDEVAGRVDLSRQLAEGFLCPLDRALDLLDHESVEALNAYPVEVGTEVTGELAPSTGDWDGGFLVLAEDDAPDSVDQGVDLTAALAERLDSIDRVGGPMKDYLLGDGAGHLDQDRLVHHRLEEGEEAISGLE